MAGSVGSGMGGRLVGLSVGWKRGLSTALKRSSNLCGSESEECRVAKSGSGECSSREDNESG